MLGAHQSIAGGLVNALLAAEALHMDCVQVFTHNQRQWRVPALDARARDAWLDRLSTLGWHRRPRRRVVSHASYLINLASPDPDLRLRSIALHRQELERCEELLIPACVVHPGAHLGRPRPPGRPELDGSLTPDERAGLERAASSLDAVHRGLPGCPVVTCLETTAGAGSTLGWDFDHLALIRRMVREPRRVAFCLDTCHVTAAGYDMSTAARAARVLRAFDRTCGLARLRVVHVNDSAAPTGSRRDRHAHIGRGTCGMACFRAILNCPRLAGVPKILETPKGTAPRGLDWDAVNLRTLRRLVGPRSRRSR